MAGKKQKELKITLKRSTIGRNIKQKRTAVALGLRKPNQSVTHADTPVIRRWHRARFLRRPPDILCRFAAVR